MIYLEVVFLIQNLTKNTYIAQKVRVADSFFTRLKGLLGTDSLAAGSALVIAPCSSVHTFGMVYPIDVLFIDAENRVVRVVASLAPGRIIYCKTSSYVIEAPAGIAESTQTEAGDQVLVESEQHRTRFRSI